MPLAPPPIQQMTQDLCKKVAVDFSKIKVIYDQNRKEEQSRAFATFNKYVGIGSPFLALTKNQQRAILAHELIHIKHNDAKHQIYHDRKTPLLVTAATEALVFTLHHSCSCLERQAKNRHWERTEGLVAYTRKNLIETITYPPYQLFLMWVYSLNRHNSFSRSFEKRADIESTQLAGTGRDFIEYLKNSLNKYGENQAESTHPFKSTRIAYLEKEVARLNNLRQNA
jgi:Zn-dependent protease with chaperone function